MNAMANSPLQALSRLETSALLGIVEQAGLAVLTLVENLIKEELLRSRLTRAEVLRQLITVADSLAQLAPTVQCEFPDLDWEGWHSLHSVFHGPHGQLLDDALWFASSSLVPATVMWLRLYRKEKPEWFCYSSMTALPLPMP